ncbi:MAG: carbamoyltransferase HypF, partial [Sulfurimonas sp.]|nr:carbamoyltransferase HypF [Sulfurimonas sp.]
MGHFTYKIEIRGRVQGVGFRPFIYTLATSLKLYGSVLNNTQGVLISVATTPEILDIFLEKIEKELPPLAFIDNITTQKIKTEKFTSFEILDSEVHGESSADIPPDIYTCTECEKELLDSKNRRFNYPFISCTHCGVRYSMIYDLPYDRENTSMKEFEMCKQCSQEYTNPLSRRYHAQPIGCFDCGPKLQLLDETNKYTQLQQKDIPQRVVDLLLEGNIFAIKGVGGYHLVCDAGNDEAIKRLRERKKRAKKPFALMVKDINMVKSLAKISEAEEKLLLSKERPIVLLQALCKNDLIAPNISYIGLMLPYTPLHILLLDKLKTPLVVTSANLSDDPICTSLEEIQKLEGIYDYILEHNRIIVNACDDSVMMIVKGQEIMLRRARGYAPTSVKLPFKTKNNLLAMGANQKSTIAIAMEDKAILSPHIGDLNSISSVEHYEKNIQTLKRIYDFEPDVLIHDKHPNYESTKLALKTKKTTNAVQHHYAHILGVMAEKKLQERVFGVVFDGTGYGEDKHLWGGEFMTCDYAGYERVAHIKYFKLLGGAKAIKEPKRVALSLLFDCFGKEALSLDTPAIKAFSKTELNTYFVAWKNSLNAPLSSSVGRLFDAIASLLGIVHIMSYEGESGMMLEALYDEGVKGTYSFTYKDGIIDIEPMIKEIILQESKSVAVSKFFHTLVEIISAVYKDYERPIVLGGGVFQNRVLLELVLNKFPNA